MSNSLKILNHFLRNLDKTLKILSNRKQDGLEAAIKSSAKICRDSLNEKSKSITDNLSKTNPSSLLKADDAAKQLENVRLVIFCLQKYVNYLLRTQTSEGPKQIVKNFENLQTTIEKKSKEFFDEKNLKNLTSTLSSTIGQSSTPTNQSESTQTPASYIGEKIKFSQHETSNDRKLKQDEIKYAKTQIDLSSKPEKDFQIAEQKLSERSKATRVPATRLGRIASYGELAAGLGIGTIIEISKRRFGLVEATQSNPLFTEANANRIVKTLCKVRGAALKIGQILSIQDVISPELARIFERVRQSADYMPEYQLNRALVEELGADWRSNFREFDMKPFAAASIGQVHHAVMNDGREVALKIQYPGVAEGIESDIKNLVSLLKVWNVLPPGLFIDSIIKVTKKELSWELDYEREVEMCKQFSQYVDKYLKHENLKVPQVIDNLCTKKVITSELVHGIPIDKINPDELGQERIDDVARRLLKLLLYEIFIFKFMQTDPNWSNFFYNPNTNQISLIDFGAARSFSPDFVHKYYRILKAASHKDRDQILKYSIQIGFLTGHENKQMIQAHIDSVLILGKVFENDEIFNFGGQDISIRIHETVPVMLENRLVPPPDEIYSLHRKLSGVFFLMVKLKARINCRELFNTVADYYEKTEELQ